jgi:ribosomal protein L40E
MYAQGVQRIDMAAITQCERCGSDNPAEARFCIECGASLVQASTGATTKLAGKVCPTCYAVSPENARFCVGCGQGLNPVGQPASQPRPPARPQRQRTYAPPRQSYPRIDTAPTPILVGPQPAATARPRQKINEQVVFFVGLFLLFATQSFWPGILALIGLMMLVSAINAGRPERAFGSVLWLGGLAVLFATGSFWPGILLLLALSWMLSGGRRCGW